MRLVFAGTPAPAVPSLQALLDSRHEVVGVITRPDARSGRGRRGEQFSPVKELALAVGVPVLQPRSLRDDGTLAQLRELAPDVCPVVAYGGLVPTAALTIPTHGWVNLHFSVLPAWRGAAPVQHAIIAGDTTTGASVFQLEEGLDTGPVYAMTPEPIGPTDTAGDLLHRLAISGAALLTNVIDSMASGTAVATPQPAQGVSLAPKLTTADAGVDLRDTAVAIGQRIRGCTPSPGAWTMFRGDRLRLGPVTLAPEVTELAPGQLQLLKHAVLVGTSTHAVALGQVQAAGKKPMAATDWARGVRPGEDERLG